MKKKIILLLLLCLLVLGCSGDDSDDNPEKTYYSLMNKYGKDNVARVGIKIFVIKDKEQMWFYQHSKVQKNPYSGRVYSGYKTEIIFGE